MKRKLIQLILVLFITNAYAQHPLDGINGRWAIMGDPLLPEIFTSVDNTSDYNLCAIDISVDEKKRISGVIIFYDDVEFHVNEMIEIDPKENQYLLKGDITKCEPWHKSDNVFKKYYKTNKSPDLSFTVEITVRTDNIITIKNRYMSGKKVYDASYADYFKCSSVPFPRFVVKTDKTNVVSKLDGVYENVEKQMVKGDAGTFIRRESWSIGFLGKEYYWYEVELNDGSRGYVWSKDVTILETEKKGKIDKKYVKGGWREIEENNTSINYELRFRGQNYIVCNGDGETLYNLFGDEHEVRMEKLEEIGLNEYHLVLSESRNSPEPRLLGSIKIISPFCIVYTSINPADSKRRV